ncbi:MAG: glycosyltransferase [Acidobacteria bacterium]|nr:glycosyltransferase [Acidobacteriota bacterium]
MRGGEKVLEVLCERLPEAEIFTLLHVPGSVSPAIERLPIHASALQRLPGIGRYYRECLPLFPFLVERFDLDRFDLVISSSHCVAKSAMARPGARHLCYCHTPMRYAWDQFDAYFGPARIGRVASRAMRVAMARLARWDRATSGRAHRYVTNSQYVADRIRRYYNREAIVVYPPVDTSFFRPTDAPPEPFALVVSALVPYKRVGVAIDACRIAGIPLTIVGTGPERSRLERAARGGVTFTGRLSDEAVRDLYRRAAVTLMPGEEDFGIVPLEAQACGRPVVALARGGALESVAAGDTGVLVADDSAEAFADGIRDAMTRAWDARAIRRHAERFGRTRFGDEMAALVDAERALVG